MTVMVRTEVARLMPTCDHTLPKHVTSLSSSYNHTNERYYQSQFADEEIGNCSEVRLF